MVDHEPGFVLFPGYVASDDGRRHWLDAEALIDCYRVPRERCIVAIAGRDNERRMARRIGLGPRSAGDYAAHLARRLRARSERQS